MLFVQWYKAVTNRENIMAFNKKKKKREGGRVRELITSDNNFFISEKKKLYICPADEHDHSICLKQDNRNRILLGPSEYCCSRIRYELYNHRYMYICKYVVLSENG